MPLELQFEQLRFRKREREGGRRRETLRERCSEREREIEGAESIEIYRDRRKRYKAG